MRGRGIGRCGEVKPGIAASRRDQHRDPRAGDRAESGAGEPSHPGGPGRLRGQLGRRSPEALDLLDEPGRKVDLLLADLVMPGMRGDDLARRAAAMRPGLNVLLMSGYSDQAPPKELGPTAGITSFIDKPFDAGALLERVWELLRHAAPNA